MVSQTPHILVLTVSQRPCIDLDVLSVFRQMSEVENVAVSDGRCGQTLPRQLGVSHEPRRQTGQVPPERNQRLELNTLFNHLCYAKSVPTGGMYFGPFAGVTLLSKNRTCLVAF